MPLESGSKAAFRIPRFVILVNYMFAPEKTKLPGIQGLRAIAALAVMYCHSTYGLPEYTYTTLGATGRHGYLGVYMFFVISGFIVPFTMFHGGYTLRNFWRFMAKRMIRVEPPYLASIAISLLIWWASRFSAMYRGGEPQVTWTQLGLHLGYLIPYFPDYKWISGVYWSLAVEFQYYISLSLLFPLFISRKPAVRITACLAFASVCLIWRPHQSLLELAPVFVVGIVAALYRLGIASRNEMFALVAVCAVLTSISLWWQVVAVTLLTWACVVWLNRMPVILLFIGDISYSLYLLHDMVGRRVVHIGQHFVPERFDYVLPFAAMAVSLVCAFAMYRILELPAKRWASSIKYRREPKDLTSPTEQRSQVLTGST